MPDAPDGFDDVYRAEAPALVRFPTWQGARLADAADVAQEAMIDAYGGGRPSGRRGPGSAGSQPAPGGGAAWPTDRSRSSSSTADRCYAPGSNAITAFEQQHDVLRLLAHLPPRQRPLLSSPR
ncbi:hypothetical protein Ais01nite_75000 [Asanoa ishikariensis]|uniref:hypothetical protein n=1 Tax=Asanoa ishikariensis TaxID=137265 RepID=UPI000B8383AF|nr:hypothetical protein [Asanoa ishikariensis]GIF69465.1 hypothetical protein Ais01nite_75000 [Asanoa ishikariensis]